MTESTDTSSTARSGSRAANFKQRIAQDGRDRIETGKRTAADQIAEIADAIDLAGSQLDGSQPTLASYATQLANGVGTFATRLREDSVEDIYREVRQLAARHPGMFLLGSAAVGLVAARFMKASAEETSVGDEGAFDEETFDEVDDVDLGRSSGSETPDPYGSPSYGG